MKKILMFGTMLGVASAALAFGGVFNHGSKSSTYKGGVDAIGVHFGGEKKTADITADTPSCPEHSEWNGSACECNLGWTLNESDECTCPEERQCGDTCCGEHNICVDGNKCCYGDKYEDEDGYWHDNWRCCDASVSSGYSTEEESCCAEGTYPSYNPHFDQTYCCPANSPGWGSWREECCAPNTVLLYVTEGDHTVCCPEGSTGFDLDSDECI